MRRRRSGVLAWLVLIVCSSCLQETPLVRAQQQAPRTDPIEAAALNTILGRWGGQITAAVAARSSPAAWNISGDPCTGAAVDGTGLDGNNDFNPGITCACPDDGDNTTVCHITMLYVTKVYALNVVGQIPSELQNLTYLTYLNLDQNYLTGPIPSFIGQFSAMQHLSLGFNPFSGPIPKELGNLTNLNLLGISLDNFSGGLPEELGNLSKLEQLYIDSSGFSGPFPSTFSKLKELRILVLHGNSFEGPIPVSLSNLTRLTNLIVGDIVNGSSSLAFVSNLTSLSTLILRNCKLSGNLEAVNLSKLANLILLLSFITTCNFNFSYVYSILPSGLNCLQQDTPCFLGSPEYYSFAVDCGSNRSTMGPDNTVYDVDPTDLGASSYYVNGHTRWGVSNVGKYNQAANGSNIIYSSIQQFQNTADPELFQTARMSASSLRYYGLGLENGNYTVVLQFAETAYPDTQTWQSLGRRVFDIYVQGFLREKNFNIRKAAGGKSFTAVSKSYTATVSKNFLEIHLFWAGKGTCCIPRQGYYGPMISALSVTPSKLGLICVFSDFTPTVRNGVPKKKTKASAIAGIVISASVLGLAALFGIFIFTKRRKRIARKKQELYDLIGQPNVFSYAELKLATDNFSPQNLLGKGGYGPVYKAWGMYEGKQPLRIMDTRLEEFDTEEALRVIHVALICTQGSPHQRPTMSRVVAMLTGKAEVVKEMVRPSYVTEWQLRDGTSSCSTSSYWESTTPDFSRRQKEVDPLTLSPTITGASDEIEGR
nr:unnamed protein product [Digitaria exilis]